MQLELMVHIKQLELSHFKSFGGTTKVPILPGFTVSGPNGSGKSNILDALFILLGLASSKGMPAELTQIPDFFKEVGDLIDWYFVSLRIPTRSAVKIEL